MSLTPWRSIAMRLKAHAEREAGVLRIDLDVREHPGSDHAAAADLDPAGCFAAGTSFRREAALHVDPAPPDEREVRRSQPDPEVAHEEALHEVQQRALEIGERDVRVDGEPFDLREHRAVRRVVVATIDMPGRDDADRRRLRQHRAHLHRARVRAQHDLVRHVERVLHVARRVILRDRERLERVPVGLDLRALGDREADLGEDLLRLEPDLREQVQVAGAMRPRRQGHVDRARQVGCAAPANRRACARLLFDGLLHPAPRRRPRRRGRQLANHHSETLPVLPRNWPAPRGSTVHHQRRISPLRVPRRGRAS
jgi:hypothetical protein